MTEEEKWLDNVKWARQFMEQYERHLRKNEERKHKISPTTRKILVRYL